MTKNSQLKLPPTVAISERKVRSAPYTWLDRTPPAGYDVRIEKSPISSHLDGPTTLYT